MKKKKVPCPVCLGNPKKVLDCGVNRDGGCWEFGCDECRDSGKITEKESRKIKSRQEVERRKYNESFAYFSKSEYRV